MATSPVQGLRMHAVPVHRILLAALLAVLSLTFAPGFSAASDQVDRPEAETEVKEPAKKEVPRIPKADHVITDQTDGKSVEVKTVKAKVGEVLEFRLRGERAMTGWGGGVPNYVGEKNKPRVPSEETLPSRMMRQRKTVRLGLTFSGLRPMNQARSSSA